MLLWPFEFLTTWLRLASLKLFACFRDQLVMSRIQGLVKLLSSSKVQLPLDWDPLL